MQSWVGGSVHGAVHTKLRNRLSSERARNLSFIRYNRLVLSDAEQLKPVESHSTAGEGLYNSNLSLTVCGELPDGEALTVLEEAALSSEDDFDDEAEKP